MHILDTARLRLRTLELDDAPFYLDLINQPSFIANIADKGIRSVEAARQDIAEKPMKMQADYGFSLYLMSLKECGTPVGICGLIKRDTLPHVDIGYAVLPQFERQGYTFEAASAVCEHARAVLGIRTLLGITDPANLASSRLLQKLGMQLIDDKATHNGGPSLTFSMNL